ncbi:MAG TPA: hypothetical protein VHV77_00180, partial [Pirellulales bacterium]|nr:hypothetical protein [Pirellulales bacterium]
LMRTKVLVVVGEPVNVRDGWEVLRTVGACVDPHRDVVTWTGPSSIGQYTTGSSVGGHVGIDATPKLAGEADDPTPEPLVMDSATAELLTMRWKEYGL